MKTFKFKKIFATLATRFLKPDVIQASAPQFIGAALDTQSIGQLLAQVLTNGASAAGGVLFSTSAAATATLTNFGKSLLAQFTNGGAVTVTLDSAFNIGLSLPGPLTVGQTFGFQIMTNAGTTIATPTLTDSTVTLAGTTSVAAAALRWYQGVVTQVTSTTGQQWTAGTTFTSLTQVGSTNLFTVALGTNANVPTVGNLIYLSGITGTLPVGWYPIVKVTSATSFVIATPPGPVWTATAATVGTSTVAPATYSPQMTITGLMSTVTATMAV
jgi:hypothetical protein